MNQKNFCSVLSAQAGESLYASASRTEHYLLLEYNGAWGAKAFEESQLPEAVKSHLSSAQKKLPNCKLLLLHRASSQAIGAGFHFYICHASEQQPSLYEFQVEDYNDLLDLDIEGVLDGEVRYAAFRRHEPLFLVCTNGKRDTCCAKFGLPVFAEIAKSEPEAAWQCSHLGGHRFAANLLLLPQGILYGRMDPENATAALAAYRRGEMALHAYRGRTSYPPEAQAGEYYLRRTNELFSLDAIRLAGIHTQLDGQIEVRFQQPANGNQHVLRLRREKSTQAFYDGCSLDKTTTPSVYHLVELKQEAA